MAVSLMGIDIATNVENQATTRAALQGFTDQVDSLGDAILTNLGIKSIDEVNDRSNKFFKNGQNGMEDLDKEVDQLGRGITRSLLDPMGLVLKAWDVYTGIVPTALRMTTGLAAQVASGLGKIAEGIVSISKAGGTLTTGYEQEMQQLNASARAKAGQMGLLGPALDKVTGQAVGLAKGMNVSAQTAAEAAVTFQKFGGDLKAVGITSAAMAVQLNEAYGVSAASLAEYTQRMRKEMNLTDREIASVVNTQFAMGRATGDVKGALNDLNFAMGIASDSAALLNRGFKAMKPADLTRSLAATTSMLFKLTGSADVAKEATRSLARTQIDTTKNFADLFAGANKGFPTMFEKASIATGDINKAFKLMASSPQEALVAFAEMALRLKKTGGDVKGFLNLVAGQMGNAFGPSTSAIINKLGDVDDAAIKVWKSGLDASVTLGKGVKDVYRSTKTLQQSYDDIMNGGLTNFRQIGLVAGRNFVAETAKSYDAFNAHVKKEIGNGGALGMLYTKMSEISVLGAKALFPTSLQPAIAIFGQMHEQMKPTLDLLNQFGINLSSIFTPMGALSAAALYFGKILIDLHDKGLNWSQAFSGAVTQVKADFAKVSTFVSDGLAKIGKALAHLGVDFAIWAGSFDFNKFITESLTSLAGAVNSIFGSGTKGPFSRAFNSFSSGLTEAVKRIDWGNLLTRASDIYDTIRARIVLALSSGFKSLTGILLTLNIPKVVADMAKSVVSGLRAALDPKSQTGNGGIWGKAFSNVSEGLDNLKGIASQIADVLLVEFRNAWALIKPHIPEWFTQLKGWLNEKAKDGGPGWGTVGKEIAGSILKGMWDVAKDQFPIFGTISSIFHAIKVAASAAGSAMEYSFANATLPITLLKGLIASLGVDFDFLWTTLKSDMDGLAASSTKTGLTIKTAFDLAKLPITLVKELISSLGIDFGFLWDKAKTALDGIVEKFTGIHSISKSIQSFIEKFGESVTKILSKVLGIEGAFKRIKGEAADVQDPESSKSKEDTGLPVRENVISLKDTINRPEWYFQGMEPKLDQMLMALNRQLDLLSREPRQQQGPQGPSGTRSSPIPGSTDGTTPKVLASPAAPAGGPFVGRQRK